MESKSQLLDVPDELFLALVEHEFLVVVEVLLAAVAADEARRVQVRRQFRDDDQHLVAVVEGGLRELEEVRELVSGSGGEVLQRFILKISAQPQKRWRKTQ